MRTSRRSPLPLLLVAPLALSGCGGRATPTPAAAAAEAPLLDQDLILATGSPSQLVVPVPAGENVVVTVTSDTFDPVLEVVPPGGDALHNDDYQGSRTKSQLTVHTTHAGPLRLAVSAFGNGAGGPFHVSVRKVPSANAAATFLTPGSATSGTIRTGDRRLADGREVHEFLVLGPAVGGAYELRLTAQGETVPLAVVLDPNGRSLSAMAPGVYPIRDPFLHRVQLIAPTAGASAGYRMELRVVSGPTPTAATAGIGSPGAAVPAPTPAPVPTPAAARPAPAATPPAPGLPPSGAPRDHHALPQPLVGRPLTVPATQTGELTASSLRLPTGESAEVFVVDVAPGSSLSVDAASETLDTYLLAVGPDGHLLENDDADGTNAHLDLTFPTGGRLTLVVTTYQAGSYGRYVLKVGAGGGPAVAPAAPPAGGASASADLGAAESIRGELADGDRTLGSGEFIDAYRRRVGAGESLQVRASSSQFDPYLIVRSPSGHQLDNDDYAPPDRAAGIDVPSTEAGEYTISVTSYQAGERGRYELQLGGGGNAGPAPTGAPANAPAGGTDTVAHGGASGEARVFGIFTGISDYPSGVGDLDECANDALKLAEAMRSRGLMRAEQQVVLTDGQATVAAVRAAFTSVRAQMGPNDTFVFFHSGHGAQRPGSRDSREIDGSDETIVMHDGQITDDEMGQLFDQLHAKTAVLSLDSCFAGGFAKDVITRPGRVGFFSSEEDVESSVASQFQAGGYLSYFLREGVMGQADIGPRDNVLTVGELQHFLTLQFGRHATDVELAGAYQHLVVDRGAVRSTEVLWRYR